MQTATEFVRRTYGPSPMERVLRRMESLGPVSAEQRKQVETLGKELEVFPAKAVLQTEDEPIRRPCFVVSGWACRLRYLSDGRRQIIGLVLPGDGIGVRLRPHPLASTTVVALTRLETASAEELVAPHRRQDGPELAGALARAADEDERLLLAHVVRLGRHTAYERLSHLMLELHDRLAAVGMARESRFPFPLTQDVIADTLGLSVVHVNRTLQSLRRDGLLRIERGYAVLPDRAGLAAVADYWAPPARRDLLHR